MRGFRAFLAKELLEIVRTWRIWVLPGIVLFFALSGPVLAVLTPELLKSVGTGQAGIVINIPKPTYIDAYAQWVKNLSQIVVFALIIIGGGLVASETKAGTASLVLTKPLSRRAFVLAKFIASAIMLVVTVVVGALVTWGVTALTFGEAPVKLLAGSTGAWLAFGVLLVALMTLLSSALDSQAGAAGAGLGAYLVLAIAGLWGPLLHYSPAGLVGLSSEILAKKDVAVAWPLATGAVAAVLCVAAAMAVFSRKEL